MPIQKEEKTIWKVITTIEKKFLNHLINHVEELENVCLSKLIFKFEKKKNEILKYYEKIIILEFFSKYTNRESKHTCFWK